MFMVSKLLIDRWCLFILCSEYSAILSFYNICLYIFAKIMLGRIKF